MRGEAEAFGAVTIVNAIPAGKGGAASVALRTKAKAELNHTSEIRCEIVGQPAEDTRLMEVCARMVLSAYGLLEQGYGVTLTTESEIPIARGLKSSSAAANAIVLALAKAASRGTGKPTLTSLEAVKLGVEAALEAGVSITGAFDDAYASCFGGWVLTDNSKREVLASGKLPELDVLILVPEEKLYTKDVPVAKLRARKESFEAAFELAKLGRLWEATILNGILGCSALGFREAAGLILSALEAGALAAGLSGTGPAVFAICEDVEGVEEVFEAQGKTLRTTTNNQGARVF